MTTLHCLTRTTTGSPAHMKFECCHLAIMKTCWGDDAGVFGNMLPNTLDSSAFWSQAELELRGTPKQATCNTLPLELYGCALWFRLSLTKFPACRVVSSGEAAAKGTRQGNNLESRRAVPQLLSWQHAARRLYTQYPAEVGAEDASSPFIWASASWRLTAT